MKLLIKNISFDVTLIRHSYAIWKCFETELLSVVLKRSYLHKFLSFQLYRIDERYSGVYVETLLIRAGSFREVNG